MTTQRKHLNKCQVECSIKLWTQMESDYFSIFQITGDVANYIFNNIINVQLINLSIRGSTDNCIIFQHNFPFINIINFYIIMNLIKITFIDRDKNRMDVNLILKLLHEFPLLCFTFYLLNFWCKNFPFNSNYKKPKSKKFIFTNYFINYNFMILYHEHYEGALNWIEYDNS